MQEAEKPKTHNCYQIKYFMTQNKGKMEKTGNYLKATRNHERKHKKNYTVDASSNEIGMPFGPASEGKILRPEPYVGTANDQMYDESASVRHNLPLFSGASTR